MKELGGKKFLLNVERESKLDRCPDRYAKCIVVFPLFPTPFHTLPQPPAFAYIQFIHATGRKSFNVTQMFVLAGTWQP